MSIALFAIIGAKISAGAAYWICFAVFCALKATVFTVKCFNKVSND